VDINPASITPTPQVLPHAALLDVSLEELGPGWTNWGSSAYPAVDLADRSDGENIIFLTDQQMAGFEHYQSGDLLSFSSKEFGYGESGDSLVLYSDLWVLRDAAAVEDVFQKKFYQFPGNLRANETIHPVGKHGTEIHLFTMLENNELEFANAGFTTSNVAYYVIISKAYDNAVIPFTPAEIVDLVSKVEARVTGGE
jgi:hypothetical protein